MLGQTRRAFSIENYILITIVITLCLQTACSSSVNGEISTGDPSKPDPTQAISSAEELFGERADIEKLKSAVKLLSETRDPATRNYDVEWMFAKYSYFLGKALETEQEKVETFEAGRDAAKIASRIHPDKPDGHFWYAANLGELSRISPITVGIKSVDDIREAMNKVIDIEPSYQGASAYDALGQLEMETRSLGGGKAARAVEHLEKGHEINRNNANIRLHLAEAYLAIKRDSDALKMINELLASKPDPQYAIEHEAAVSKARRLLETQF